MKQKQMQDRLLENRFESAIKNKEFVAYFQPKYDVKKRGSQERNHWCDGSTRMVPW